MEEQIIEESQEIEPTDEAVEQEDWKAKYMERENQDRFTAMSEKFSHVSPQHLREIIESGLPTKEANHLAGMLESSYSKGHSDLLEVTAKQIGAVRSEAIDRAEREVQEAWGRPFAPGMESIPSVSSSMSFAEWEQLAKTQPVGAAIRAMSRVAWSKGNVAGQSLKR